MYNINDSKTQSVAEAVKKVIENKKDFKPHMMYDPKTGKGYEAKTHEDHLKMKDMGYTHEKPSEKNETEVQDSDKDFVDLHNVDKKEDPEKERQVESKEAITEDVDNFFGFPTKDGLVKFQSMAKKLKIKPISNPVVMKRGGKEFHVMGFEGSVRDIEKAMKVAAGMQEESVDFTKEGNEFTAAAAKAKLDGKDEFEFDGKKYPVEIGQDAAEKILGKEESVEVDEGILGKIKDKINPKKAKAREALAKMAKTKEKLQAAKDKFLKKAKNAVKAIDGIEDNAGDYEDPDKEIQDLRDIAGSHRFDAEEVQKKIDSVSNKMAEISKKFGVRAAKKESVEIEESVELQEAADFGDIEKVMKWAKKNIVGGGKFPQLDISKKYGTAFINLTIMNIIILRLGGKKGIVVTHDDRTSGKGKDYEEHFSSANDVIKFVQKIYDEMPKDESTDLEEAIKPAEFVKGGDAKVTKREVDGMLSKLFIDSKLAKAVEANAAYQDGYKGKVKKNPFKKDTADFHLFVLGQQSAEAE